MLQRLVAALLVALLPLAAQAATVVIREDGGGSVDAYNQRLARYRQHGTRVVIAGNCMSACTRFMSLPTVCARKGAHFYFHGISDGTGRTRPDLSFADSTEHETTAAVALQSRYGAFSYGVTRVVPLRMSERLEPGVRKIYLPFTARSGRAFEVWLRVRADKLVPRCP